MPDPSTERPTNREVENGNLKPTGSGAPRSTAEPRAFRDRTGSSKTRAASDEHDETGAGPKSLRDTPKVG